MEVVHDIDAAAVTRRLEAMIGELVTRLATEQVKVATLEAALGEALTRSDAPQVQP